MNCLRWILFIVMFLSCYGISQKTDYDNNHFEIGKSLEITRFDMFHAVNGTLNIRNAIKIMPSLGIGIQKTYALKRFHPRFSLGLGLDLFKNKTNFNFGPEIRSAISAYSLNSNQRLTYTEGFFGYFLAYGDKWRLNHQLSLGKGVEKRLNDKVSSLYWGFHIAFGIAYVL